jgi:hypothetical protein
MTGDGFDVVDPRRSACLCDVGAPGYTAALVVGDDGTARLVLVRHDMIGDPTARYDGDCQAAAHEQCGPLPFEFARRLTLAPPGDRGLGAAPRILGDLTVPATDDRPQDLFHHQSLIGA